MVKRFTGSGRQREGGFAATHRQDFNAHTSGGDWRHTADQTDMNPRITDLGNVFNDKTVQGTLQKMAVLLESAGQGFITIGDGYNTAPNTFTVGSGATPSLRDAFTAAFNADRLINGGIILVKAGTYRLDGTVTIPAGISVMGEVAGTVIISETNDQPMFQILRATKRFGSSDGVISEDPLDKNTIYNIVLADNLDGYALSGEPTMTTVPMISLERGANLLCEQVTFLGRMRSLGAGPGFGRAKTFSVFGTEAGSSAGTTLVVDKCTSTGTQIFASFNGSSSVDRYQVNNCKIQVFGTESPTAFTDAENCFFTALTDGSIHITNNILNATEPVTGSSNILVKRVLVVTGGTPDIFLIGNSGGVEGVSADGVFVGGATSISSIISGNNFNNQHIQNQWFLTIGDGTSSMGDITGSASFDTVLNLHDSSSPISMLVVNPGSYTVNGLSGGPNTINFSVIGNGPTLPVLNLALTFVGTSYLGQKYLTINGDIENISFSSTTGARHSIIGGINTTLVRNCKFTNTSYIMAENTSDLAGSFLMKGCSFSHTAATSNAVAMLLAPFAKTVIEDCRVTGSGYAVAAGDFPSISYTHAVGYGRVIDFKNCSFIINASSFGIAGSSPVGTDRYIVIDDDDNNVSFENCEILTALDITEDKSPVDSGLLTSFASFVEISAKNIYFKNCKISGPAQEYKSGSDYAMPALFCEPRRSLHVDNCKIFGALPLQVSGADVFDADYDIDAHDTAGFFLHNSYLSGYKDSLITNTLLDVDVSSNAGIALQPNTPKIEISGCNFANNMGGSANPLPVLHTNVTGGIYITQAAVQIYANMFSVHFHDNHGYVKISTGTEFDAAYTNLAGVLIDAFEDPAGGGSEGSFMSSVIVSGNSLTTEIAQSGGAGSNFVVGLWVHSPVLQISDNYLQTSITASSSRTTALLYLDTESFSGKPDGAVVNGNIIGDLVTGAFSFDYATYIASTSGTGMIVDNYYLSGVNDTYTRVGTGTNEINDTTGTWLIERNKNQEATLSILVDGYGALPGTFSIHEPGDTNRFIAGGTTDSGVISAPNSGLSFFLSLNDAAGEVGYEWLIGLDELLPPNVQVIDANVTAEMSTGVLDTTGDFTFTLDSTAAVAVTGSLDFTVVTSGSINLVPPTPLQFKTGGANIPILYITAELQHSDSTNEYVLITDLDVTYRW